LDVNNKSISGFHIGLIAEFPIIEKFSFETGIIMSTKGFKVSESTTSIGNSIYNFDSTMNLFYLEVPLAGKASYDVGGAKIYGVFGPYLGLGLSGRVKMESTGEPTEKQNVKWGSGSNDDVKRLDYGLIIGAGVEIQSILLRLSYSYGLANIISDSSLDTKSQNRVLSLSVGYKFGSKRK